VGVLAGAFVGASADASSAMPVITSSTNKEQLPASRVIDGGIINGGIISGGIINGGIIKKEG
jgi:hypothetical protein